MPEMRFNIRWPDGTPESCYSPSLVIKEYFSEGETYPLADFLARSRTALRLASDSVQAKYGFSCALAIGQLAQIEATASHFAKMENPEVTLDSFLE